MIVEHGLCIRSSSYRQISTSRALRKFPRYCSCLQQQTIGAEKLQPQNVRQLTFTRIWLLELTAPCYPRLSVFKIIQWTLATMKTDKSLHGVAASTSGHDTKSTHEACRPRSHSAPFPDSEADAKVKDFFHPLSPGVLLFKTKG